MNKEQFVLEFQNTLKYMEETMIRKNHDYSWWDTETDPFKNFKLVSYLSVTSVERGLLVRMCDKMSRISSLIDTDWKVKDEAITDTLVDLANYSLILSLYIKSKSYSNQEHT